MTERTAGAAPLELRVLGPIAVRRGGVDVDLGGPLPRALLTVLAAADGRTVAVARLVEELWGDDAPASAESTVASYVSRLRRRIDPPGTDVEHSAIRRQGGGYALVVPADQRDDARFRTELDQGRRAMRAGRLGDAAAHLDAALAAWRDDLPPLDQLPPSARPDAIRLLEERTEAEEVRLDTLLRMGRHAELVGPLEAFAAAHPLRERAGQLLALALYRSGRQTEALAAVRALVERLDTEYGLEPRPELRRMEHEILAQDPALDGGGDQVGGGDQEPGGGAPEAPGSTEPRPQPPPTPITRLVGRGEVLDAVADRLADGRLVTLVGPGGSGKTRLAVEIAGRRGAAWAPLADVPRADQVEPVLVTALGGVLQPGVALRAQLVAAARSGPDVLVVDNAEHVVGAVAEALSTLLAEVADLGVLVTSRAPLGIAGEVLLDVPPLATRSAPAGDPTDGSPAAELFLERAAAAAPGWVPDAHDRAVAEALVARLDGLPLAVELAAARVRDLSPDEILEGLGAGPGLLSGGTSSTPHHASVASAIAWSYELLDPADQRAFRALAAFDGPFDLAAAATLLGGPAIDAVSRLAAGSLLVSDVSVRPRRYRMLHVVREWARAATPAEEAAGLRRTMALWGADLARSYAAGLRTLRAGEWFGRLDRDIPNLRGVLHAELADPDADPLLALQIAVDLKPQWHRVRPEEGVALVDAALARAVAAGYGETAIAADAHLALLRLAWAAGDNARGLAAAEAAAALAGDVDRPVTQVIAVAGVAFMVAGRGDVPGALDLVAGAVDLAARMPVGRDRSEAIGNARMAQAVITEAAGRLEEALALLELVAGDAVVADEWTLALAAAYYRGRVALRTGHHALAAEVAAEGARLALDVGIEGALVQQARNLGAALVGVGRSDVGARLVASAGAHEARLGVEVGYADARFAEAVEAEALESDAAAFAEGASWNRAQLVTALLEVIDTTPSGAP